MKIYTPITFGALREAMHDAFASDTPCAIRYPNGTECEDVIEQFYRGGQYSRPSAVRNYADSDAPDVVIVTHGRMVYQAMKVSEKMKARGVSVGIILLEMLKPFGDTVKRIAEMLPQKECGVIFLEEEIRCGGMGSILSEQMVGEGLVAPSRIRVLAVEDSFVEGRRAGQTIYDAAGLGVEQICDACQSLLN